MDVVYLCRAGQNEELRYSLRSLTNVPHDRVWIIGQPPVWVRNAEIIRTYQRGDKHANAGLNFRTALDHDEISDPFWLWNDDFYATAPAKPLHYHRGPLAGMLAEAERLHPLASYTRSMRDTLKRLDECGYPNPRSFELHVPIVVHKGRMVEAMALGPDLPRFMYRTAYGTVAKLRARRISDVKVYDPRAPLPAGPWASTSDMSFRNGFRKRLHALFPKRGCYE